MATRDDVLKIAEGFAKRGYKEGPNNDTRFGDWYGLPNNPWCAMFLSYCTAEADGSNPLSGAQSPKGYASVSYGMAFFKNKKAFHSASKAKAGDHAFFDWNRNGSPEHVGLVLENHPASGYMITVEGNTSSGASGSQSNGEGVFVRKRFYSTILGVGRPAYTKPPKPPVVVAPPVVEKPVDKPVAPKPKPKQPTLKGFLSEGSRGILVRWLQNRLDLKVDGHFGPRTRDAVVAFQKKHDLRADGVVGRRTWKELA